MNGWDKINNIDFFSKKLRKEYKNEWIFIITETMIQNTSLINDFEIFSKHFIKTTQTLVILLISKDLFSNWNKIYDNCKLFSIPKIVFDYDFRIQNIFKIEIDLNKNKINFSNLWLKSINFNYKNKFSFKTIKIYRFNPFYTTKYESKSNKLIFNNIDFYDYNEFFYELRTKISEYQNNNIKKFFPFMQYEPCETNNKMINNMILINMLIKSKKTFPTFNSLFKKHDFKSKNDLKYVVKNFENLNANLDKLKLTKIILLFLYLNSKYNNLENKDEINSIIESIKKTDYQFDSFNIPSNDGYCYYLEYVSYKLANENEIGMFPTTRVKTAIDIIQLKKQLKDCENTLFFKYFRYIIKNYSQTKLNRLHNDLIQKVNAKDISKIPKIDFKIKKDPLSLSSDNLVKFNLITNSVDLYLLGQKMGNCVYSRKNLILNNHSLIYQVDYKNENHCLELSIKSNKIKELKAKYNEKSPNELVRLINKKLKQNSENSIKI